MFAFTTTGRLERLRIGTPPGKVLVYQVVFLEPSLERALFEDGAHAHLITGSRLRFSGEVEDIPVELAWQPARGRGHYVMISPALCKQLELRVGTEVTIRFTPVDPRRVVVPEDVARAVATRRGWQARWDALAPGARRALIAHVASARTELTRARRIDALFEPLARMPGARRTATTPDVRPRAQTKASKPRVAQKVATRAPTKAKVRRPRP